MKKILEKYNYNRRHFLRNVGFGLGAVVLMPRLFSKAVSKEKPNIVLIMVDNLGYGDFGISGNKKVRTPNIDKFAREAIQFSRFYCNPMCAPSRASLMTGRYYYRTGVIHTSRGGAKMHGDEITIAEYLHKAGYATGMFGKWHLGDNHPMRPQDQGFSQSLFHKSGRIGQVPDYPNSYFNPVLWQNGKKVITKGYCTDVFTGAAIKFIEDNRDKPFFVYLPTNAGHTAKEDEVGLLVDSKYSEPYKAMGLSDITAKVYGMVTNIDENFRQLIEKLDELKIRENTIFIFTSDDGPGQEYNAGLRNGTVYEARIRVPFLIQWPEGFKGNRKIDTIASHIDVLPTLLDACGLKIPEHPFLDGVSLIPLLSGKDINWKDRRLFFQCHRGLVPKRYQNCTVITQRYKMVGYPNTFNDEYLKPSLDNPILELYDLLEDPGEENNIAESHPEILKSLRIDYDKWFKDVKGTRQFIPGIIHIGSDFENPTHLCRYQDSAYYNEKPTGWPVFIEKSGKYEIAINRGASNGKGTLFVKIDKREISKPLKEGENKAVFDLPKGKFKLNIWVQEEGETYILRSVEDTIGDVDIRRL